MKSEFYIREKKEKKKLRGRSDKKLLLLMSIILILGSLMVFSAGYPYAKSHYGDGLYYLKRQIIFVIIGRPFQPKCCQRVWVN